MDTIPSIRRNSILSVPESRGCVRRDVRRSRAAFRILVSLSWSRPRSMKWRLKIIPLVAVRLPDPCVAISQSYPI